MVGLGNSDNTSDLNKPVSTAAQTALDLKANASDVTTSLALKANLASPTFTGTVAGIDKTMVGLGNSDNTSDLNKPVSTATQTALDLKAPLASPTFTGTVAGIDKTMVGLGNVDNTSDLNKPVSTAAQAALDLKLNSTGNATTATTAGNITATSNTTLTSLSNLATVGTITSGVWSGTAVAVEKGGTGLTSAGTIGNILTSNGTTWTSAAPSVSVHTIGESYGGGIVFYVTTGGLHGLIAETQNQSSSCSWYDAQNIISTTANHSDAGALFIDWRLPTKYELNLLYIQKGTVGVFANNSYWSSTEYDFFTAWGQHFLIGNQTNLPKNATNYVRAIRAF
jgi:hypothetical protein